MGMMSSQTLGIIIGGLLPALIYGGTNFFVKVSTKAGIGLGLYLILIGLGVATVGASVYALDQDKQLSMRSGSFAFAVGVSWGLGSMCVALGLTKFGAPLSKLVPLFNMNTLVAVALALIIFSEWQQVKIGQLLLGAVLIVIGGTLVARA